MKLKCYLCLGTTTGARHPNPKSAFPNPQSSIQYQASSIFLGSGFFIHDIVLCDVFPLKDVFVSLFQGCQLIGFISP